MSANDNTSTLKSAIDAVTGAAQNAIGSITGSTTDQAKGEAKQHKANAEYDASQATVKIPGFTASSSGAVTKDDPDRAAGAYNQTMGSAKEALGGLIGSESVKAAGRNQNREGQDQEAKGQINDYVSGVGDRITGTAGAAFSSLTGNTNAEAEYRDQHNQGKTQQRGAEHDIKKKADAEYDAAK
ncbi:putative mismatched base pair and cruciform dna recognition protein [Rosellinia necatrix]|uniref:Putative mismatched base pair and cruciform dna recognition protein n=1 Tax=Rosellinia necatrix TaxID=77044 RepID=A0A1S7UNR1_ROSNE|nr:putative mismatched base pair and cruciform dna recognition protein [Rosellinia necatrix]